MTEMIELNLACFAYRIRYVVPLATSREMRIPSHFPGCQAPVPGAKSYAHGHAQGHDADDRYRIPFSLLHPLNARTFTSINKVTISNLNQLIPGFDSGSTNFTQAQIRPRSFMNKSIDLISLTKS
jgi:hypothetical protein